MQHNGAALGEAGQDDALGLDTGVDLRLHQVHHPLRGFLQLRFVDGALGAHGEDVVPGRHGPAAIDGHRPGRRLGQHEAGGAQDVLQGLGHGQEVIAVRAQTMEPDDAGVGPVCGFENKCVAHGGSVVVLLHSRGATASGRVG
ncbi:hypothetical protein D9M71_632520 [compost metagenome]